MQNSKNFKRSRFQVFTKKHYKQVLKHAKCGCGKQKLLYNRSQKKVFCLNCGATIPDKYNRLELVCNCGQSNIVYDEHHDEFFCLNCGAVIQQNFTVYQNSLEVKRFHKKD